MFLLLYKRIKNFSGFLAKNKNSSAIHIERQNGATRSIHQFYLKGGDIMSTPSAPYYYKEGSDTYHWETSCSKNHYPAPGWKKTNSQPSKEQCNECKSK
jgi:hypothetical protein